MSFQADGFAQSPATSRDNIPARSTSNLGDQTKNKKSKPPDFIDPFSSPKLFAGCPKGCRFSVMLGICVALRCAVLALLCCPWSVATFDILFTSHVDVSSESKYNLDSLFTPEGGAKVDVFRVVASCFYLIDLVICFLASCLDYCTGNIKTIRTLCVSWLVFTLANLAVAIWGAVRFIIRKHFITIFYVDLVLQPVIALALLMNILWLRSLIRQGFIVFPRPLKDEAKFKYAARLGKENNMEALQRDPDYREIFGLRKGTVIEADPEELAKVRQQNEKMYAEANPENPDDENANLVQPSSEPASTRRNSFTSSRTDPNEQQPDPFYYIFYPSNESQSNESKSTYPPRSDQQQMKRRNSTFSQTYPATSATATTTDDADSDSSSTDSESGDKTTQTGGADGAGKGDAGAMHIHLHTHKHKKKKKKKKKNKKKNKKKKSKKKKKRKSKRSSE